MSYNLHNMPERDLNPPEDRRKCVYSCAICEGDILEGDGYYEIPDLGPCCEECIDNSKKHDAQLEYNGPDRREDY